MDKKLNKLQQSTTGTSYADTRKQSLAADEYNFERCQKTTDEFAIQSSENFATDSLMKTETLSSEIYAMGKAPTLEESCVPVTSPQSSTSIMDTLPKETSASTLVDYGELKTYIDTTNIFNLEKYFRH
ncbi:hypothetical protein LL033_17330 [Clostridium estertheticum]|uniref:hypothetical protein n=1 Tax=Clostridium estertheticum TaxID=238834 RepID=UPI001C0CC9AB|nr:hypothetical protein [Clostridium estertheticum]MBU3216668.1 hypothetical protein [Clostridium estertheticum]WAG54376.1 hypothetical protein LL033_17330 [Clostridium estertheticum]